MLFNLYLLTTGASIATDAITLVDLFKRLKEDGYVINKDTEKSSEETLQSLIVVLSTIALPGFNAYFSYKFRNEADKQYEAIKAALIEKGAIREMTWEEILGEKKSFEPTHEEVMNALKGAIAQKATEGYNAVAGKVESTVAELKENEKVQGALSAVAELKENEKVQGALSAIDKKRQELLLKKELIKMAIQRAKEEAERRAMNSEEDYNKDDDKSNSQEGPKKR